MLERDYNLATLKFPEQIRAVRLCAVKRRGRRPTVVYRRVTL
jgi:hypothetical protein